MPNKDRSFHEAPEKAGGEGWLYSEQQQKLCHCRLSKVFNAPIQPTLEQVRGIGM